MKIGQILSVVENFANPALQEGYDNSGLLTGNKDWDCNGVLCALDATVSVVKEALQYSCNLIIVHHPVIFSGLKKLTGATYVEQVIIEAIKNDVAIYAAHTNLDNVAMGVNHMMAEKLHLTRCRILQPKPLQLSRLVTFAPLDKAVEVREALFAAGAGALGKYDECSFNAEGLGTFKATAGAQPYVGEVGIQHQEKECRIEVIFPFYQQTAVVDALLLAHPYEEVAYDVIKLENVHQGIGAGLIGELDQPQQAPDFFQTLKEAFQLKVIRHTAVLNRPLKKIAVCGGAGSFLIKQALANGADAFVTADIKYHEFFDAQGKMVIADIGHYESEQFTVDLLHGLLEGKFPTFAVLKTSVVTNPVAYFV